MQDVKTIRANGLDIAYLEAGSGPLVLLLHGFPDTAETWRELLPVLASAGYRAVAPFLRGYYPTSIPADGDYSLLALAQDALALAEALGEKDAVIVGHDWGASVGYVAANLAPARVRQLVTIAIPHMSVIKPSVKALRRAPHFLLFQAGRLSEWWVARHDLAYIDYLYHYWSPDWQVPAGDIECVKDGFRRPGRLAAALGFYQRLFRDQVNPDRQSLYQHRTAVPTLTFGGKRDGALDWTIFEQTRACYSGRYELVLLDHAGHFLHREQPAEFARRLLAFLGPVG